MSASDEGALLADRYRLIEELGKGGMGTVWRALDVLTEREVAVKRLRKEYAKDAKLRRRLRREARAVARLEHANIVRLYDMGETPDGNPFFAMEMVRGRALSKLAEEGLAFGQLLEFIDQILAALAFAHARGVIHRDLKPDNVIVATNDAGVEIVKLLDFGFARVEDDSDDQITQMAKDVFGTPTYMAPEQATGDHEVTPATDLYALGIMLWELLTGKPPYTGRSGTAIVVQHVTKPLPPFEPLARYPVPPEIKRLLDRALEKEPARRFDSAGEMRRAIAAIFDDDDEGQTIVSLAPAFDQVNTDSRFQAVEVPVDEPTSVDRVGDSASSLVVAPGPANPEEVPLVGREVLLRWLWDQVALVCRGQEGRCVLLEGAVGVGKSRCCSWLRQALAEGGWMTAAGEIYRPGAPRGGGFRAVILGALGLTGSMTRHDRLRQVMAELDPEGRVALDSLAAYLWPEGTSQPVGRVVALVDAVVRLIAARRPLFIWLDDLQHAVPAELAVFEHLLVNLHLRPAPVLLFATRRTDSAALSLTPTEADRLTHLLERRHELVHVRRVEALGKEAMASLVRQSLPVDPDTTARVVDAARGIPLYAVQAVRYLYEVGALTLGDETFVARASAPPLPQTLVDLMRARLGVALQGKGEGLRGLLERLALLGEQFSFGLGEAMARGFGVDAVRLETGLDALARSGLLVDQAGDAFAFAHALMREALLQTVAARPDAAQLHARVAEAKTAWHEADLGPAAAEIARHHLAAGQVQRAVEFLLVAAGDARASFQYDAAQSLYTEADRWLTESGGEDGPARADVFLGLAEVALELRDIERGRRLAQQIGRWARTTGDQARLAAALRLLGEAQVAAGQAADAEQSLQEADQLSLAAGDALGAGKVGLARGRAALQLASVDAARHHFFGAAAHFRIAGDARGEAACKRALGELALRGGDRNGATRLLTEAADTAAAVNDQHLLAQATWRLGELLRQSGQLEGAVQRYRQAVDAYDSVGNASGVGRALRGLGDTQRILHRPEAARTYRRAVELFEEMEDLFQLGICYTQLGRLATDRNDLVTAEAAFERALHCLEQFDDPVRLGILYAFLARIAQRRGDAAARDHRLDAALRIDAQRPLIVNEWPKVLEEAAEGHAAEQHNARAKELLLRAAEVWTALRQEDRAQRARRWAAGLPG